MRIKTGRGKKPKKIYKASLGAMFNDDDAQVYGNRLEILSVRNNGKLTPGLVVDDARADTSPTHNFFEWDDEVAAEKHRLQQARHMISHIIVEIEEMDDTPVRAFYNVKDSYTTADEKELIEQSYVPLETVMSDAEYRKQVITNALNEIKGWRERYKIYTELSTIFKAIDRY